MLVTATRMFSNVRRVNGWLKPWPSPLARETEYGDNDFESNCFSAGQASFPLPDINIKVEKDNNGENVGFGGVWKDLNANLSKIDHHGF
ncbi:hypothetical protein MTR67_033856 [Solanum verrucosum]|uniref:Uncharacterized protein n=1 Tax=Solanum verrucosum TaxID=315347 RepID=A0AAF0ZHZ4_SOLVR|nr:hypothetical protein MTR67_033856 [Solanum verrucosum]